jgi:hypothetical protein
MRGTNVDLRGFIESGNESIEETRSSLHYYTKEKEDEVGGGVYKLNPPGPELESAWSQPLILECDILVSSLCCQLQLVPLR